MQTLIFSLLWMAPAFSHDANVKPPPFKPPVHYARACINEICGPAARVNNHLNKFRDRQYEYSYRQYFGQKDMTDFPPATAKLIEEIQQAQKKADDALIAHLKASVPAPGKKTEGFAKAIDNLRRISGLLDKVKFERTKTNGQEVKVINEEASRAAMKGASVGDQDMAIGLTKLLFADMKDVMSESSIESNPPDVVLKALHPDMSTRESMLKEIDKAKTQMSSFKDSTPMEKAVYSLGLTPEQLSAIEERAKNGSVDENEARAVLAWNTKYARTKSFVGNPKSPLLTGESRDVEELVKKAGGVEGLEKQLRTHWAEKSQKRAAKVEECKAQYFLNKGLLPNPAEVARLKSDVGRAKKMVAELVKGKFPPSAQAKALKAIEKAEFVFPPTAADFEKSFARNLEQNLSSTKADLDTIQKVDPADVRPVLAIIGQAEDSNKPKSSENDEDSPCDGFRYEPFSDANYTLYGSIVLSYSTATASEEARLKTIMHELGHSVSKAISDDPEESHKFLGVRRCLEQQHTEQPPPTTKQLAESIKANRPAAPGYYAEEDFADSVAFESGKDIKGGNPWCALLTTTPDRQDYDEDTMQARDGDVHSADLFRLLNAEITKKGSLPDTCRNFFKTVNYVEGFKSCLDLAKSQYPNSPPPASTH